ncbi:MAG TPA: DUF1684 domain-containing protein [Usitatibacter sp.]|nr:DUF1684 domain-containing protein [Usitatibacter sp.]
MKFAIFTCMAALIAVPARAVDSAYVKSVEDWRARAEESLRKDNGWLTLAGRYVMKPGVNTFGTGAANDMVFPPGLGAERMGAITVEPGKVSLKAAPGVTFTKDGVLFSERLMGTDVDKRDWVSSGRAAFHVIEREGRYVLRLADNESEVRKGFGGRVWYDVNDAYRVNAKFLGYQPPRKISIVNVLDEVSEESAPGYVEFELGGRTQRLDALSEDGGLFIIFRDATAGQSTYGSGRFLYVEKAPQPGERFLLDLNRAYNPPCAFSEFTTCPLPPKQNILPVRVEAGEKYPPRRLQPASHAQARIRELQAVLHGREASREERGAARRELLKLLKSPAAGDSPEEPVRPARASIDPYPSVVKPVDGKLPAPPPVARLEVAPRPAALVNPSTGSLIQPSGDFAIDTRTGAVLRLVPGGYLDPASGQFVPRP